MKADYLIRNTALTQRVLCNVSKLSLTHDMVLVHGCVAGEVTGVGEGP